MVQRLLIVLVATLWMIGINSSPARAQASKTTGSQEQTQGQFEELGPPAAAALIQKQQSNPDFAILDVRTPEEFAEGHLERAINVDLQAPTFRALLDILNKQKTYLVYCRSGHRSGQATQLMKDLHFSQVYNMTGGILEWTDKQLPVVK